MSLSSYDRSILNYRPDWGVKGVVIETMARDVNYKLPPNIDRLADVTPSDLLGELGDLLDEISKLNAKLELCLEDDSVDGVPFKQYAEEKRKDNPDHSLISKYEDYHESNINGNTQSEVFSILSSLEDELSEYRDFLNKQYCGGEADYSNLSKTKELEEEQIRDVVNQDIDKGMTLSQKAEIDMKAQQMVYAMRRIDGNKKFVEELNKLLYSSVNEYYNGSVRGVVEGLSQAPDEVMSILRESAEIDFKRNVIDTSSQKRRSDKLNSKEAKRGMNKTAIKVSDTNYKTKKLIEWAMNVDTDYDTNPMTQIVTDVLDSADFVQEEQTKSMVEMLKQNELESRLRKDMLDSMKKKKNSRQVHSLMSAVEREKKRGNVDIDKFISDNKLESPGNLCTR